VDRSPDGAVALAHCENRSLQYLTLYVNLNSAEGLSCKEINYADRI